MPKIREDPRYLAANDFELLSDWSESATLLDPLAIDWSAVSAQAFPYKLREKPGPGNALGRIKFMFPNRFNVYMHDAPARAPTSRSGRCASPRPATSSAQVQEQIDAGLATITGFLREQGIEDEAIQPQRVEVTDLLAQPYRPEGVGDNRFILAQTVIVRTEQVDLVAELNQQTGELIRRGVVLVDTGGPTYLFTRLNDIKPELLAEATRNARAAAEQFAADSGSEIAEIRRASQGLFEILARDPAPDLFEPNQQDKKIRVVSTIEYRLSR